MRPVSCLTGVALLILPRPGGDIPEAATRLYKSTPGNIPFALIMIGVLALAWLVLRSTRYRQYLLAIGSQSDAAYSTGIPVNRIRLSAYVWSGLFSGLAALALTMNIGSGSPRIGDSMTLDVDRGGGAGRDAPERGTRRCHGIDYWAWRSSA